MSSQYFSGEKIQILFGNHGLVYDKRCVFLRGINLSSQFTWMIKLSSYRRRLSNCAYDIVQRRLYVISLFLPADGLTQFNWVQLRACKEL